MRESRQLHLCLWRVQQRRKQGVVELLKIQFRIIEMVGDTGYEESPIQGHC